MVEAKQGSELALRGLKKKKTGMREYASVLILLLVVLWWSGVFDMLKGMLVKEGTIEVRTPRDFGQKFVVITPTGEAYFRTAANQIAVSFVNSGMDNATIKKVGMWSDNGTACKIWREMPVTLKPGDKLDLMASDCVNPTPPENRSFGLVVYITGNTTARSASSGREVSITSKQNVSGVRENVSKMNATASGMSGVNIGKQLEKWISEGASRLNITPEEAIKRLEAHGVKINDSTAWGMKVNASRMNVSVAKSNATAEIAEMRIVDFISNGKLVGVYA